MALPPLTPEQRAAALEKAAAARRARAELKVRLKTLGPASPRSSTSGETDEAIGKMKVLARARGPARRRQGQAAAAHGEARDLARPGGSAASGAKQREALEREFERARARDAARADRPADRPVRPSGRRQGQRRRRACGAGTPRSGCRCRVTTRPPRPGERDGVAVPLRRRGRVRPAGRRRRAARAGRRTPAPLRHAAPARCEAALAAGGPALLEIDLQGARQVRAAMPERAAGLPGPALLGRAGPPARRPRHRGRGGAGAGGSDGPRSSWPPRTSSTSRSSTTTSSGRRTGW